MNSAAQVLRPIYQPFGQDIFCSGKKYLVFNMVRRNLKTKYRDSIFGILWTLLSPLAMTAVYYFVFKVVLNVQVPHHLVFFLSGILTWNFVSQSLFEGMESIVGNIALLTKVPIPLQVFPFVGVSTNLITYLLATPILYGAAVLSDVRPGASLIMLPFYWLSLFLITYGISLFLAMLFVNLRDLRHLMGIVLQVWFYATPIIYDENMIPEKYQWVLHVNPYGYLISDIHTIWVRNEWPSTVHITGVAIWAIVFTLIPSFFYKTYAKGLVEQI